jgi:hypothetical protein
MSPDHWSTTLLVTIHHVYTSTHVIDCHAEEKSTRPTCFRSSDTYDMCKEQATTTNPKHRSQTSEEEIEYKRKDTFYQHSQVSPPSNTRPYLSCLLVSTTCYVSLIETPIDYPKPSKHKEPNKSKRTTSTSTRGRERERKIKRG